MTSAWKTEANRRNSEKSTGPKTDAGKERSRANAVTHGLSGEVVLGAGEALTIAERLESWRSLYLIDSPIKEWAFEQFVVNATRIETCQANILKIGEYEALRARHVWDIDRAAEAAELGAGLSRRPEVVAKKLRQSKHGCQWMLERWSILGGVLDAGKEWSDGQLQLALDLCGVDRNARDEKLCVDPKQIVLQEFSSLQSLACDRLEKIDEFEKNAVILGVPIVLNKKVGTLRRYQLVYESRFPAALRILNQKTREPNESVEPSAPMTFSATPELLVEPEPDPEEDPPFIPQNDEDMKVWEANFAKDLAALALPTPVKLSDSVKPVENAEPRPMNRKQRKAAARRAAQAKAK